MASLNKQQLVTLHRKVKEINYNSETNTWDIIFIDKNGTEVPGTLSAETIGMNYYLALQIIIVNYCLNNDDEANLWKPTTTISDIHVETLSKEDESALYQYYIEYENGIAYSWKSVEKVDPIEIVELLIINGITYFVDNIDPDDFIKKWVILDHYAEPNGALVSIFNNSTMHMKAMLRDNANLEITEDSIIKVYPYLLKAAFMLYGMVNTKFVIPEFSKGNFTNCDDLRIPSFEIEFHPGMKPELVLFDDLTYTLLNKSANVIAVVNE